MAPRPFTGPVRFGTSSFLPPVELRALPFDALRHQLPTRNPVQAGRALQQALRNAATAGYEPPQLLPRSLVQSRWKRAEGVEARAGFLPAGSSVPGLVAALEGERARQAQIAAAFPRTQTIDQAAVAHGQQTLHRVPGVLPTPGPARTRPLANSVAAPELLTTFDLAAFVRKAEHRTVQARAVRATRQADTLTEAKAATLTGWRR